MPPPSCVAAWRNVPRFEPTRSAPAAGQAAGSTKSVITETARAVFARPNLTGGSWSFRAVSTGSDSGADSIARSSLSARVRVGSTGFAGYRSKEEFDYPEPHAISSIWCTIRRVISGSVIMTSWCRVSTPG